MSFETAFTVVMTIFVISAPVAMVIVLVRSARAAAFPSTTEAARALEPEIIPDYAEAPLAA